MQMQNSEFLYKVHSEQEKKDSEDFVAGHGLNREVEHAVVVDNHGHCKLAGDGYGEEGRPAELR